MSFNIPKSHEHGPASHAEQKGDREVVFGWKKRNRVTEEPPIPPLLMKARQQAENRRCRMNTVVSRIHRMIGTKARDRATILEQAADILESQRTHIERITRLLQAHNIQVPASSPSFLSHSLAPSSLTSSASTTSLENLQQSTNSDGDSVSVANSPVVAENKLVHPESVGSHAASSRLGPHVETHAHSLEAQRTLQRARIATQNNLATPELDDFVNFLVRDVERHINSGVFDELPVGVLITGKDGRAVLVNAMFTDMTDWQLADLSGDIPPTHLITPAALLSAQLQFIAMLAFSSVSEIPETPFPTAIAAKSGRMVWTRTRGRIERNSRGEIERLITVFRPSHGCETSLEDVIKNMSRFTYEISQSASPPIPGNSQPFNTNSFSSPRQSWGPLTLPSITSESPPLYEAFSQSDYPLSLAPGAAYQSSGAGFSLAPASRAPTAHHSFPPHPGDQRDNVRRMFPYE